MTQQDMEETIARRLRQRRLELGMKLAEVGAAAGVSDKRVCKFESGENGVSAALLYRLANALRTPMSYFFVAPNQGPNDAHLASL